MNRALYIPWRLASDFVGLVSRGFNATFLGGSTAQTTSARAHLEAPYSKTWARGRAIINALFFWQMDHCAEDWAKEVERARYTLQRLEGLR